MDSTERTLWDQYKTNPTTENRNRLVEQYLPYVHKLAYHYEDRVPAHIQHDDMVSAGAFALLRSVETFDPDNGAEFLTYCRSGIIRSIRREGDRLKTRVNGTSVSSLTNEEDEQTDMVDVLQVDPSSGVQDRLVQTAILKTLDDQQKRVIVLHYYRGMRLKDVAKTMNLGRQRVSRIHSQALCTLRDKLQGRQFEFVS